MTDPADSLALRLLATTAWRARGKLAALSGGILLLAFVAAYALPQHYTSRASLIFLLGPEYTVREPATASVSPNTTFDPDHILGTEDAILSSPDLARAAVAAVGVGRLYPALLAPPSALHRLIRAVEAIPATIASFAGAPSPPSGAPDPADDAQVIFADHLVTKPSKLANVIDVSFSHRDPGVAHAALAATIRLFLAQRRAIYAERQDAALAGSLERARAAYDLADRRLAAYRAAHAISDYSTQLDIALHAQAEIAHDAEDARRQVAAASARRFTFDRAAASLPVLVQGGTGGDIDAETAPIREGIEALRARQADTLSRYRPDSDIARALGGEVESRGGDLAHAASRVPLQSSRTVRNEALDAANAGLLASRADLAAATTQLAVDQVAAARVASRIDELDRGSHQLDLLYAERTMRLANYQQIGAAVAAEAASEAVEAKSAPAVRIAASPSLPEHPGPTRLLILLAGTLLAGAAPAVAVMLLNACRRTILLPGELEQLGIAVLAECPRAHPITAPIVPLNNGGFR